MMTDIKAKTAQVVWEILNAALYDLEEGNKEDGINAVAEAIQLLEGQSNLEKQE